MADSKKIIIADGHVHIHDCFALETFFDAAISNFTKSLNKIGYYDAHEFTAVLFLTESFGVNRFEQFNNAAHHNESQKKLSIYKWHFKYSAENNSLYVIRDDGMRLILIAGKQIVTAENLEVLGLGIVENISDGSPTAEVIDRILDREGIPVIPWGFGKWAGKRGKLVKALLKNGTPTRFFLGDNGNRPIIIPLPRIFRLASEKGIRNIPGSDPLPFPSEEIKPGSFGLFIETVLNEDSPAQYLIPLLKDSSTEIKTYGKLENPVSFVQNQIAMQFKKRK